MYDGKRARMQALHDGAVTLNQRLPAVFHYKPASVCFALGKKNQKQRCLVVDKRSSASALDAAKEKKKVHGLKRARSVGAVGAPVVREEADFGFACREDVLQAALLRRVAHVIQHPVEQLADGSRDMMRHFHFVFTT